MSERRLLRGDLSSDHSCSDIPPGTPARGHTTSLTPLRALTVLVLCLLLALPGPARAEDGGSGSSPTTGLADSTTTAAAGATTTSGSPTTSTIEGQSTTTTTVDSPTSAPTTPDSTSTTSQPPSNEPEDPLEEGVEGAQPELLPLPSILFPVVGPARYRDTYDEPRDGGTRKHRGTDISADRGTPVVAVADGVVERVADTPLAGLHVVIRHANGWRSAYVHLNNDSPGTDNGLAVGYGPGIRVGVRVRAGTLVGYVGDSGNSEETTPHLHFELHQPDGYRANPYPALRKARRVSEPYVLNSVDYDQVGAWNAELVAHLDPGHGFNADLDVVDGYAFMGTWGVPERCPGNGVKVMDVRDPSRPESLGSIADHHYFPGTSTASLWVGNVFTPHFQGRLGVIGLAACDPVSDPADDNQLIGFATYDLTDPANPALLDVERIDTPGSGVHSLDVSLADGQIVLAALVPEPRPPAMSTRNTIHLFDLSDPQSPTFLSRWQENSWQPGPVLEAPYPHLDDQVQWLGPGTLAAGLGGGDLVVLDITDVSDPKESWRIAPLSAENYAPLDLQPGVAFAGRYLMVEERPNVESDEDPRGRLLAFDFSRQEDPSPSFTYTWEIGNDTESPAFPGFFLPHRSVLYNADDIVVASMSGGVRVVGLDDAGEPVERAYLVPAPTFDPQRWWVGPDGSTDFPMVWDVETENGYVYASDHNSGLWIFRLTFPIDAVDGSNQSE